MDARDLQQALEMSGIRIHKVLDDRISVYCPFPHDVSGRLESRPSMSVYIDSGMVVCFSCGYKKGIDRFLVDRGMGRDAAQAYAKVKRDPTPQQEERSRQPRYELYSWMGSFRRFLPRNLVQLGFTTKTLDLFEVGYDTRYSRVTYPVRNQYGELVAIVGGAISKEDQPKYKLYDEEVNLPKGVRQNHRDHLWGFHLLPPDKPLIVVEGYKACMWMVQHGYRACATQGTQFTDAQVKILTDAYRPVKVMFDQGGPGQEAGRRLCAKLMSLIGQRASLVVYPRPDAMQPDWLKPEELAAMDLKEAR